MTVFLALLGCHDADITEVYTCAPVALDDSSFGVSAEEGQRTFHADPPSNALDWNQSNALGVEADTLTLDPVSLLADEATACTDSDDNLVQLIAPVQIAISGEAWIPDMSVEGELVIDAIGTWLRASTMVPLPSDRLEAARVLLEAELGVAVASAPTEAMLKTGAGEGSWYGHLDYTHDQTVEFVDQSQPEPMGAEVRLATTSH